MNDADRLARIRDTPWISELLARLFDFDIARSVAGPLHDVQLPGGEPLEMIAGDAGGGAFLRTDTGAVVYAGSEGEGGLVAYTLRDAMALIVGLPSLHDALAKPLDEELLTWILEADLFIRDDWPELDEQRARLREALDLPRAEQLLEQLHEAAADEAYRPHSVYGPYEPMLASLRG